ncbi:hypothetical protein Zmor_007641 [Zophobas morio]|uniref:Odorant receptor n=1 Tax=Zophobas morio TaxID=2755281 RepID=A0AA38IVY6_9CUCU|nr:hypothetical protein Zmor_007641 [Zophobas morio]
MEKFVWQITIKVNIFVLRLIGLWPKGRDNYKIDSYTLYSLLLLIFFMTMHDAVLTYTLLQVYTNLEALTEVIFMYGLETLLIFKVCCFMKNMTSVKEIMHHLNDDLFQPKNPQQIILVHPGLKEWKITYTIFSTSMVANIFFWTFYPILDGSVKERRLPFLALYPYDFKKSPFYQLTYLHQIISVSLMAIAAINIDMFLGAVMAYIGSQCELICDNLKNIQEYNFAETFLKCVRQYKLVLTVVEKFEGFFSFIVLGQLLASGVCIGLAMFHLTLVVPLSSEFYSLLFYIISISLQIFQYCWFGNQVEMKVRIVLH